MSSARIDWREKISLASRETSTAIVIYHACEHEELMGVTSERRENGEVVIGVEEMLELTNKDSGREFLPKKQNMS